MVNLRLALVMLVATALGAIFGALLVASAPVNALRLVFSLALYAMIVLLSLQRATAQPVTTGPDRFQLAANFLIPPLEASSHIFRSAYSSALLRVPSPGYSLVSSEWVAALSKSP